MATITKGRIVLTMDEVRSRNLPKPVKSMIPGINYAGPKVGFVIPATERNVDKVNTVMGTDLVAQTKLTLTPIDPSLFRTEQREHQTRALSIGAARPFFGFFMEPGLGKTKTLIDNVTYLNHTADLDTVLVVCPKSVMIPWLIELEKHGWWDGYSVEYWDRGSIMYHQEHSCSKIRWLIMNPEALTNGLQTQRRKVRGFMKKIIIGERTDARGFDRAQRFLYGSGKCMVVVDESTLMVNPDSLRTRQMMAIRKCCEYRRIMTGTPFADKLIDAYAQFRWLDPETVEFRGPKSWEKEFCVHGGFKGKQIVGYRRRNDIKKMVHTYGFRCRTSDVLDLKEPVRQTRWITWSKKWQQTYKTAQEELLLMIDEIELGNLKADSKMFTKLWQLCGGTVLDDTKGAHVVAKDKVKDLQRVLREIGDSQVLVWCHFKAEVDLLVDELSKDYRVDAFRGGLSIAQRKFVVDSFNEGLTDILICQDDAAHLGLTINAAPYSIFYTNHVRSLVREQAERRNWRDGQKETVVYIDLLTKGGRDQYIKEQILDPKIQEKEDIMNATPDELRRMVTYE